MSSSVPAKAEGTDAPPKRSARAKRLRFNRITKSSSLKARSLFDDDARSDRHAIKEIDDVIVDQPEAARRDGVAYRLGLVRAMDTIDRLAQVQSARAQGIAGAAGHETRQIGLALDHLRRRAPIRPFLLAADFRSEEHTSELQSRP